MRGYEYKSHGRTWVATTETSWPRAEHDSAPHGDTVEWRLRYGTPTRSDLLFAAGVLSAYGALIGKPRRTREAVIRAMRTADLIDDLQKSEPEQEE